MLHAAVHLQVNTQTHSPYYVRVDRRELFDTQTTEKRVGFKSDLAEAGGAGGEAMDLYRLVVVGIVLII